MILTRFQNGKDPQVVICGSEQKIVNKINDLDLVYNRNAVFYQKGKLENLDTKNESYDYYIVYEDYHEMNSHLKGVGLKY